MLVKKKLVVTGFIRNLTSLTNFSFTHHQRDGSYHKIRRESQNKRPILSVYPCDMLSHTVDLRILLPTHTIVGVGIPPTIENNP